VFHIYEKMKQAAVTYYKVLVPHFLERRRKIREIFRHDSWLLD